MSWTRLSNDSCAYAKYLDQSVNHVPYVFDPIKYENCNKCQNQVGLLGGTNVSHIKGNIVDLENDLRGQTRPATKCPSYKHFPSESHLIKRKQMYKPDPPVVDTTPVHLRPCQMNSYRHVPYPAPFVSSSCYQSVSK